ncbi:hypothetical protein J8273_3819 [Carpediemonas membranifera]|uniref:Uncharacterized protein n=1 Tax=Carpediemonas membranifera TaxID=201153 RepID=A0A8J6E049_9EUKA|nr:hypothetical protein J8273_3819 [Carpediemonas membranifera]|eukprot:KAG9394569.1 hypothetical protein J8273_3819 [Carpediemonas membranifera]
MKAFAAFALFACVFAATVQFSYPLNGDKILIDVDNNVTFPNTTYLDDSVSISLWVEFQNEYVQKIIESAGLKPADYNSFFSCVVASEQNGTMPIDLTLPIDYFQLALDAVDDSIGQDLPFDIPTARVIVNNVLQNIEAIPEEYRNMTVSVYRCDENNNVLADAEPDFQSWVIIDSARAAVIGMLAVIVTLFMLL